MDATTSAAMDRKLIWIERRRFRGWGCSECAWVFNPPVPTGRSFDEVMRNFMSQRDEEFAWHVCAVYEDAAVLERSRNVSEAPANNGEEQVNCSEPYHRGARAYFEVLRWVEP